MRKYKKLLSTVAVFLICATLLFNFNITAEAATINKTVSTSHLVTLKNVANHTYSDNYVATNIGGISVGAAYNRLYVIKADNNDELVSCLYYYTNLHSSAAPKKIIFRKGILGHANAMAIDNNYIYVTQWQKKDGGEKSNIVRISRQAINSLADGTIVLPSTNTIPGTSTPIYTVYEPVDQSGNEYTRSIKAITKYSYSSSETKFIINYNYSDNNQEMTYTFASLKNDTFTVYTDSANKFKLNNTKYNQGVTMQDIHYDDEYGFFVPMWKTNTTTSYLLRYDISTRSSTTAAAPETALTLTKNSDSNGSLSKYEIESVSFIERNSSGNTAPLRLIFSCNKEKTNGSGCDSIEEITSLGTYLPKL